MFGGGDFLPDSTPVPIDARAVPRLALRPQLFQAPGFEPAAPKAVSYILKTRQLPFELCGFSVAAA